MSFTQFTLNHRIQSNIEACGYTEPTAIQEQAIPSGLYGEDVLGLAQTGTGKTAAFVLPILERLLAGKRGGVRSLILSPTRELAEQTAESIFTLGRKTGLRVATVYGGVSKAAQIKRIRSGADIVVACPGRLLDLMGDGAINLSGVQTLVLDEGDRMLDMGFLPDIRKILAKLPAKRQNLLFAATMPAGIRSLAEEILCDPARVQVDHEQPLQGITQNLYPVERKSKTRMLFSLLRQKPTGATLVFTRTKHMATKLAERLASEGMRARDLQGNMSQNNRRRVLQQFKNGGFDILVATDVAARGIDVTRIAHVINYDMPDTAEAYTHRIGRTGRAFCSGEASTFVESREFGLIRQIERAQDRRLQRRSLKDPAQQPSG